MNLSIKKQVVPAMLPKINPLKTPYPEVFGSGSIIKTKNQLMSPAALVLKTANAPMKKIKKPKM
jgi:hypothetical protein